MQKQAAYGLKIRDERSNEIQEFTDRTRSVMLALIKAQAAELLDKEVSCCSLATD